MSARTAVLLAAHGSRRDPAAAAMVQRLASRLRRRGAADEVVAGFHAAEPGFAGALDRTSADRVLVVPLFTSQGYYTEEVLPAALKRSRRHGRVLLHQCSAVGLHPGLGDMVVRRIATVAGRHGLDPARTAVLLAGHGTGRNCRSREATLLLAEAVAAGTRAGSVRAGFLDDEPSLESAAAAAREPALLVIPFLIGGGAHAGSDLPRRLGLAPRRRAGAILTAEVNGRRIVIDRPVGADPALADLLEDLVRRELPSEPGEDGGSVALVGAGPGDPGLITVRGRELLRNADVVLYDRLIAPELLDQTRAGALLIDVGKRTGGGMRQEEIERLMVEHARRGRRVVRLKGGDPFVFGRGAEEVDACAAHGVPCTVVPGVSSAIAVPAAAGIPVTARGEARTFAVVTAQTRDGERPAPERIAALAGADTLVILMGLRVLGETVAALLAAGRDPDTPVACVASGTTPRQRVTAGTLGSIVEAVERDGLESPVVTVVGEVARRAAAVTAPC